MFNRSRGIAAIVLLSSLILASGQPGWAQDPAPAAATADQAATGEIALGDLRLSGAFSRATLPNAPVGAAYLTITNTGTQADRLIGVQSPVAGTAQIHTMTVQGDMMRMEELDGGLPIGPGQTVQLAPGGFHIMLMDLGQRLEEGGSFPVTLRFERAGETTIDVAVGGVAAKAAGAMAGHAP